MRRNGLTEENALQNILILLLEKNMIHVILCGGSGTRLWPVSRTLMPKQFVQMFDGESLYQKTIARNQVACRRRIVVSNIDQYFLALDQTEQLEMEAEKYILEPFGRNTAPAIAFAALSVSPEEVLLVTPSDHLIEKPEEYEKSLQQANQLAQDGFLITFGIQPEYPETGYGYIEGKGNDVISFREKPDEETAKMYIEKGNYYWNSGMFAFQAGVYLEELKKHSPEIYEKAQHAWQEAQKKEGSFLRVDPDDMMRIPEDSVDYAVLEKSDKVKVVPADIGWSDLGSFDSLYEALPRDDQGNTLADRQHILLDSKNNLILEGERLIAAVDIEDMIIVDTPDALLLARRGSAQKVKQVVAKLKEQKSELPDLHLTVHRPWGSYTVLEESEKYKIKRLVVKPGKRLSRQKHYHRNEHWVVVGGTAQIEIGSNSKILRANESTYIPMGEEHRLENPGKVDLVIIEVQVGEYLGEDDIVRISDDFKRA